MRKRIARDTYHAFQARSQEPIRSNEVTMGHAEANKAVIVHPVVDTADCLLEICHDAHFKVRDQDATGLYSGSNQQTEARKGTNWN